MKKQLTFLVLALATCSTIYANSIDSSSFYFQKAKESKEARKIWEAEKYFQKAIEFNPDNESLRLEFGNYYCEQRKYANASQQYISILKKNPNNGTAIQKMTDVSFLLRKWADVINYANLAAKNNVKVDKVNFMVAKSYFEEENYGQAKKYLLQQITETPTHKETITLLGQVYIELSQYNEAITVYQKILEGNPNDPDILYEIALLYSAQNNDKEAVKYFELAAEKGLKQDLAFLQNLGMSYLEFDIPKAEEVLAKVLAKKPGDVEILTQIAQAHYKAEHFAKAADLFNQLFETDNKNVKALYMCGVSTIRSGKKDKGAAICDRAIALDPQLAQLRTQKSNL